MKTFKILGILLFLLLFSVGTFAQTLTDPDNGSTGVDPDLTVNWDLASATGTIAAIQIQASIGDPNFWAPQVDETLPTNADETYTFSNLSLYTTYYWRVILTYDDDSESTSQVWSFTVGDGSSTVNVPNLTIPVDEATWGVSTTPTLGWWHTTAGSPTFTIVVTDGTNPVTGSPFTTTNTSFVMPASAGLDNGTEYFWSVSANGTDFSEEWSFTPTSSTTSTNKPNLSAPVNNATWGISTTPTLSWWYVTSGTPTYSIVVTDGTTPVTGSPFTTTSTSFDVPVSAGLVNGTTYYWTVEADGQTSDEWNFTPTSSGTGTATLILNSPINGGIGKQSLTPALSWRYEQASGTSFTYHLQVADNSSFTDPVVDLDVIDDATVEYTLLTTLEYSTTYYWKVNVNSGTYTDAWSFTTIDEATGTPVFAILDLEVTNDDSTNGTAPTIPYDGDDGWEDVPGMLATGYSLQLDDITAGSGYYYLTLGSETLLTMSIQDSSYYPFYLDEVPDDFAAYWAAKGIDPEGAVPAGGTMAEALWYIMNGEAPMFYIWMNGDGDYYLLDGFMHDFMTVDTYFQVNDDYPTGNYVVKGDLSAPSIAYNSLTADSMTIDINFNDGTNSELSFSDVGDVSSPVPFGSTQGVDVNLTLKNGFTFETSFFGTFTYDESKLDFAYAEYGSGTLINGGDWTISFYESLPGEISFIASVGTSQITTSGVLFSLYFTVIDNAVDSCDITGSSADIYVDGYASVLDITAGTVYYEESSAPSTLRGDADLDYQVTMDDAIAVLNHVNEIDTLTGQAFTNAAAADDASGISIDDAMAILNYLATSTWNYTPAASVVGESVELSEPAFISTKIISLPIEVSSAKEVKSVEVEFNYDTEDFDFQSFKAAKFGSGMYTTAKEVVPGKAVLTFLAQEPISGTVKPGKISLSCLDREASSAITTRYKLNSATEYKEGPSFNISSITDVAQSEILPSEFELSQNYPNPFNPTTMIQYSMPEAAFVSLKIYNLLGQEIKTLVAYEQTAGVHNVQWNGENNFGQKVTSGIYIYRIKSGNFIDSKKLVLLK